MRREIVRQEDVVTATKGQPGGTGSSQCWWHVGLSTRCKKLATWAVTITYGPESYRPADHEHRNFYCDEHKRQMEESARGKNHLVTASRI